MPEKTKASTKYSNFIYEGSFADPIFDPPRMLSTVRELYSALKPWRVTPQDVKYKATIANPTEPLLTFELANKMYFLGFSSAALSFRAELADWSQAPLITEIIGAARRAIKTALQIDIQKHHLELNIQLVLEGRSTTEITKPLSAPLARPRGDLDFCGFILHTTSGVFVLDKSAVNENGLYVRIVHNFDGNVGMEEMAKVLYDDEQWLADVLGIEVV